MAEDHSERVPAQCGKETRQNLHQSRCPGAGQVTPSLAPRNQIQLSESKQPDTLCFYAKMTFSERRKFCQS
ncbi:hypothetical protein MHYP_G00287600 [Metynnis hypsauchen]